jgi:hypothetical protein
MENKNLIIEEFVTDDSVNSNWTTPDGGNTWCPPKNNDTVRKVFEKWAGKCDHLIKNHDGNYVTHTTAIKWDAWQAALASLPTMTRPTLATRCGMTLCPAPGEECEVSGANSDYDNGWHYTKCVLVAYSPCNKFAWFQVRDCWPFQEKIINCDFHPLTPEPLVTK